MHEMSNKILQSSFVIVEYFLPLLQEMYTPLLAVQLQHSEVGGAGVPHITPMKGNKALLDYSAIPDGLHMSNCSDKFAGQYMKGVWNLTMALWGDLPIEANLPGETYLYVC